jgi:hypothetical protein
MSDGYKDLFPWKVQINPSRYSPKYYNEMPDFCNKMTDHWRMTDHWGSDTYTYTFNFAYEEHKNWFILKFSEYLE